MTTKTSQLNKSEVTTMVQLMKLEYPDFENQELPIMALQLSKEFNTFCSEQDLGNYYSDDEFVDEFELESHKVTSNFYSKIDEYECRDRFS